jgi:hypothetical protein
MMSIASHLDRPRVKARGRLQNLKNSKNPLGNWDLNQISKIDRNHRDCNSHEDREDHFFFSMIPAGK